MIDRGRIVVVGAGFGLWLGGRCIAAGKWSDVSRVRAYTRQGGDQADDSAGLCVAMTLRDGSEVEVHEEAPGWKDFLGNVPARLPGMPPAAAWVDAVKALPAGTETILYERTSGFVK
jgi:hypothetical protein